MTKIELKKKLSDFSYLTINTLNQNRKYLIGFGTAFIGSYVIGAGTSTLLEHLNYSKETIALATLIMRTGSYFAINLPLHHSLHKKDYLHKERDANYEMKTLGASNLIGASTNAVLQPLLHWTAMAIKIKNPYAFLLAYFVAGSISTSIKFSIDLKKGVIKRNNDKSLESKLLD